MNFLPLILLLALSGCTSGNVESSKLQSKLIPPTVKQSRTVAKSAVAPAPKTITVPVIVQPDAVGAIVIAGDNVTPLSYERCGYPGHEDICRIVAWCPANTNITFAVNMNKTSEFFLVKQWYL